LIIDAEFFCKSIARHRVICLKLLLYFIVCGHIMRICHYFYVKVHDKFATNKRTLDFH